MLRDKKLIGDSLEVVIGELRNSTNLKLEDFLSDN